MGLLTKVLAAPVSGPVKGFTWIAKKLAEKVESEVFDPKKIQRELEDLQILTPPLPYQRRRGHQTCVNLT